jgi:hypothetical protein
MTIFQTFLSKKKQYCSENQIFIHKMFQIYSIQIQIILNISKPCLVRNYLIRRTNNIYKRPNNNFNLPCFICLNAQIILPHKYSTCFDSFEGIFLVFEIRMYTVPVLSWFRWITGFKDKLAIFFFLIIQPVRALFKFNFFLNSPNLT